jgi:hypothetical protein
VTVHGTNSKYHEGCRCAECKEAHRLYERDRKYRRARGITERKAPAFTAVQDRKRSSTFSVDRMLELAFRQRLRVAE